MTIFSPDTGEEVYLVDEDNEVTDLRRRRKSQKKEDDPQYAEDTK